jgi:hypothetical protein
VRSDFFDSLQDFLLDNIQFLACLGFLLLSLFGLSQFVQQGCLLELPLVAPNVQILLQLPAFLPQHCLAALDLFDLLLHFDTLAEQILVAVLEIAVFLH